VGPCSQDETTAGRIAEYDKKVVSVIKNARGEQVGALISQAADKEDMEALYLCGANSGYYYAEGKTAELAGQVGDKSVVGTFYNDEYEVDAESITLKRDAKKALIRLSVSIKFTGDEADADWEAFKADDMYLEVPAK
jgi:hypothetical protein